MKKYLFILLLISFKLVAQQPTGGTLVIAPIKPNDARDAYPTHIDTLGMGGMMAVPDSATMLNIKTGRRKLGMVVYIQSVQRYYQLKTSLTNTGWVLFQTSGGTNTDTTKLEHYANRRTTLTNPNNNSYPTTFQYNSSGIYYNQVFTGIWQ